MHPSPSTKVGRSSTRRTLVAGDATRVVPDDRLARGARAVRARPEDRWQHAPDGAARAAAGRRERDRAARREARAPRRGAAGPPRAGDVLDLRLRAEPVGPAVVVVVDDRAPARAARRGSRLG